MAYDYRDPAIRAKAHAAATLLGEPAASELRAALDALDAAERREAVLVAERDALRAWVREALPYTDPDAEVVIPTALALQARGRALLGEEE